MRRLMVLAGLPLLLLFVWGASNNSSDTQAEVTIDTNDVIGLRGNVISRMTAIGAVRVGEQTDYGDSTRSTLRFRLPATKIEQALGELDDVGGAVTDQVVDLEVGDGDALDNQLNELQSCLGALADSDAGADAQTVADCQTQLRQVSTEVDTTRVAAADAVIAVNLRTRGSMNWLFFVGILILAMTLGGIALMVLRSTTDLEYDLPEEFEEELKLPNSDTREIYLRRN